jgi:hypothetical protein
VYYVVIDGVRVASYPFLASALAHIDAHREREAGFEEGTLAIETVRKFNERQQATACGTCGWCRFNLTWHGRAFPSLCTRRVS